MGPDAVRIPAPHFIVVIYYDWVFDAELFDRALDVPQVLLEFKFRRVDTDHHKPFCGIAFMPALYVRQCADAVYARIGPKIYKHHLAPKLLEGEPWGMYPAEILLKFGCFHPVRSRSR